MKNFLGAIKCVIYGEIMFFGVLMMEKLNNKCVFF